MNIGTVVEGPTDRLVLQAILDKLCPGEHRYFPLQPTETFGETGTGWKGVRRWCYETWQRKDASLGKILSGATGLPLDLLVIHIDADVAAETDLQEDNNITNVQQPCPPATATADKLGQVVTHWLRCERLPAPVVLALPAQDTENWTFAALFPDDGLCSRADYECTHTGHDHPAYCLTLREYGRLLQRTSGRIKKPVRSYRRVVQRIAAAWEIVCRICPQAEQFTSDVIKTVEGDIDDR